jgi:recombination protein RecA
MSASPVLSSAATGRPFIFSPPTSPRSTAAEIASKTAEILALVNASQKLAAVVPASRLDVRLAPEMVASGIPQLDSLTGGLARGCLTEIYGAPSSGRTSILLFALARATERGEVCALVDSSDAFDPASAAAAGMEMSRLLWVRCGDNRNSYQGKENRNSNPAMLDSSPSGSYQGMPSGIPHAAKNQRGFSRRGFSTRPNPAPRHWESRLAQMLKATDLLLQSNGFGMIALDLGDVPVTSARRIPLASWFRFRRAVEHSPTVLLVLERQPIAGSCSSMLVKVSGATKLSAVSYQRSENPPMNMELSHSKLLDQFEITAELMCSRLERKSGRKPVQSARANFKSRAAWAG